MTCEANLCWSNLSPQVHYGHSASLYLVSLSSFISSDCFATRLKVFKWSGLSQDASAFCTYMMDVQIYHGGAEIADYLVSFATSK